MTRSNLDPIDKALGLRLLKLRNASGMSQERLGSAVGVSFQTIHKYENGLVRMSAVTMVKAARAMGVKPTAMLPEELA